MDKNAKILLVFRGETKAEQKRYARLLISELKGNSYVTHTVFANYSDKTKPLWDTICDCYGVPVKELLCRVEYRQYINNEGKVVYTPSVVL